MDLNTLRDIIEKDDGKIFVFEEGKPLLVLMSFKHYRKLLYQIKTEVEEVEEREVINLKEAKKREKDKPAKGKEDLKIDDLEL